MRQLGIQPALRPDGTLSPEHASGLFQAIEAAMASKKMAAKALYEHATTYLLHFKLRAPGFLGTVTMLLLYAGALVFTGAGVLTGYLASPAGRTNFMAGLDAGLAAADIDYKGEEVSEWLAGSSKEEKRRFAPQRFQNEKELETFLAELQATKPARIIVPEESFSFAMESEEQAKGEVISYGIAIELSPATDREKLKAIYKRENKLEGQFSDAVTQVFDGSRWMYLSWGSPLEDMMKQLEEATNAEPTHEATPAKRTKAKK
jgi:hypothetical protein